MAVRAYTATNNINGCCVEFGGIERGGFFGVVTGLKQVYLPKGQMVKDVMAEPESETLRRVSRQAEVLIHVEGKNA